MPKRSAVQIRLLQLCPSGQIKYRKKVKTILLITKKIAHKLNKEYKVPFGYEGISVSGTRRKYYLTENKYNLNALKQLTK